MKAICLLVFFMISIYSFANAASVYEKKGDVYYVGNDKNVVQLTFLGREIEVALHPKGKWVYFIRDHEGTVVNDKYKLPVGKEIPDGILRQEVWRIKTNGKESKMLFRPKYCDAATPVNDPKYCVASVSNIQFSPDGDKVYFETGNWVTSDGLHVMNADGSKEKLLGAGNYTKIIQSARGYESAHNNYRGYIVTNQHRYWLWGGTYDWYWLFTPDFKELGPLGDDFKYFTEMNEVTYTDHSKK